MRELILAVLSVDDFVSVRQLAELLGRTSELLRSRHLKPLVASGRVVLKHPDVPYHPDQAYKSRD